MSELKRTLIEDIFYPPHDPRTASTEYRKTHHKLVIEMDEPCWICGIKNSDVKKLPKEEQHKWQIETHHDELEWAAANAFENNADELAKITADIAVIANDPNKLRKFLDSEGNMLILCATHHRGSRYGIHMISYPAWKLQRWQTNSGWQFIKQQSPVR